MVEAFAAILAGFIYSMTINPWFALAIIAYIIPFFFILKKLTNMTIAQVIRRMTENAKLGGFIEETFATLKLIISFG